MNANTRRWPRQAADLPVRVIAAGGGCAVPGRGTEISAGGMALYAGVNLQPSDVMEIEFVAGWNARVRGVIRNRAGYQFGVEFLTPLTSDGASLPLSAWPGTGEVFTGEPGPLSSAAAKLLEKMKESSGRANAYALLARMLQLVGRPGEAEKAAKRAADCFRKENQETLQEKAATQERLKKEIQALRGLMLLLVEASVSGRIDPRIPELICALPRLLGRKSSGQDQTPMSHKNLP